MREHRVTFQTVNLTIIYVLISFIYVLISFIYVLIFLCFATPAAATTYTTHFPLTENPISEHGHWINGRTTGLDWGDISTTPGSAIGHSGPARYAGALFDGMGGMGRVWQAAETIQSILRPGLLEKAAAAGMRSLFVGFETLSPANLAEHTKYQNLSRDYNAAVRRVHNCGVMVNGSFVFGMDDDDESVFDRTVEWAIGQGIETATYHILTPYPSTGLYQRMEAQQRLLHSNWDLYDTRHTVFRPMKLTPETLEAGYW